MALDSGYFEANKPVITKADAIRAMDDWQLADFMARTQYANCKEALVYEA